MHLRKLLLVVALVLFTANIAQADLSSHIRSLNVSAEGNIGNYKTQVGVQYGASGPSLDLAFRSASSPGEAAVLLWLGQRSNTSVERVVQVYQSQKNQGWGAIAQSLGIKPGSADFKALKEGNLGWHPSAQGEKSASSSKGKGRK